MKKAAPDGGVGKRHSRPNGIAARTERGPSASVTKRKAENAPQLNRPQRVESGDSNTKCKTSVASNATVECSRPDDAPLAPQFPPRWGWASQPAKCPRNCVGGDRINPRKWYA